MIVLKVLGLIVLIGFALIGALVLYVVGKIVVKLFIIRHALKKLAEGIAAGAAPAQIHLRPLATPSWNDEEAVDRLAEPLPELGFQRAGTYQVEEIDGLSLQAWLAPDGAITAVIYEHPTAGTWLDFFTHFEDGTRITYATNTLDHDVEHAPGHTVVRRPDLDARAIYEKFVDARPDKPMRVITAETFAAVFEKAYNDEMAWRKSREETPEGYARNPAAAIAALISGNLDDGKKAEIRRAMGNHAYAMVTPNLAERFRLASGRSGDDWEAIRGRLLFVWDAMSNDMLESACSAWLRGDDLESLREALDEADDDEQESEPRRVFAEFIESFAEPHRFLLLGTVKFNDDADDPNVADVYAAPTLPASDEDTSSALVERGPVP